MACAFCEALNGVWFADSPRVDEFWTPADMIRAGVDPEALVLALTSAITHQTRAVEGLTAEAFPMESPVGAIMVGLYEEGFRPRFSSLT